MPIASYQLEVSSLQALKVPTETSLSLWFPYFGLPTHHNLHQFFMVTGRFRQDFGCCHVFGIEACGRRKYRTLEMLLGW